MDQALQTVPLSADWMSGQMLPLDDSEITLQLMVVTVEPATVSQPLQVAPSLIQMDPFLCVNPHTLEKMLDIPAPASPMTLLLEADYKKQESNPVHPPTEEKNKNLKKRKRRTPAPVKPKRVPLYKRDPHDPTISKELRASILQSIRCRKERLMEKLKKSKSERDAINYKRLRQLVNQRSPDILEDFYEY